MTPVDLNRLREALRIRGCGHGDYGATGPHPYLEFISDDGTETWRQCDGTRPVTDADLASLGLVQRPVCGHADSNDGRFEQRNCSKCGGSGYGRLVALDGIDVEALRCGCPNCGNPQCDGARRVLAAIDSEDTDG